MDRFRLACTQATKLLALPTLLFMLVADSQAQAQDQPGNRKDDVIACRVSVLDILVEVEVSDPNGQGIAVLSPMNFFVYEDEVEQQIIAFVQTDVKSTNRYLLCYIPTNLVFDGKPRKVRIKARTDEGQELRGVFRLKPDPSKELDLKVGLYPEGSYSVEELPAKK